MNAINFSLSGPAEWRGGIAQGPDNYILSKTLPVEGGVNRVIIRSLPEAGRVVLKATADGLKPDSTAIVSRQVDVVDGLSLEMPDAGLRSNLMRGPTPPGTSLSLSRAPVSIARVTAGSNGDQVRKSFDDDETTDWSSDGPLPAAWVKYDFDRATQVSEVVLKLVSWRTQSYPVRISVDNTVVFSGQTPRSLGYVTIKFKPVIGRSLKIELTGGVSNRDAFGNIIEIPGTPDPQSAAGRKTGASSLGIVEVEIYQPVIRTRHR